MVRVLYLQGSSRQRSHANRVADALVAAYRAAHPDHEVETINLFDYPLPELTDDALSGRYLAGQGVALNEAQQAAWSKVTDFCDFVKGFDRIVLSVPMWNFGPSYRVKQFFDVLIQPGHSFSYSPTEGIKGLYGDKKAAVVYSSGGSYESTPPDFQKPWTEFVFGFIGITDVKRIVVAGTLGPDANASDEKAIAEAKEFAASW